MIANVECIIAQYNNLRCGKEIMNTKNDKNAKPPQKRYSLFIIGLMWVALGVFGLLFDPSKRTIIVAQLVVGVGVLVYYFWKRLK